LPLQQLDREKVPGLCDGGQCFDEILLDGMDRIVQDAKGNTLVVMHQLGSHGPSYWRRYPPAFKRFAPTCDSDDLRECDSAAIVNAYDNTIAYTDHVLGSAIAWLRARSDYDGALLYVADHGESLGEGNLYLHGLPYALAPDVQKHVPWITWLSPAFERDSGVSMQCLRARVDERITHDDLFHSVLGLMQVSTSVYRRGLDTYAACEAQRVPGTLP
jgi:lipid A ethanolaminephosphotransferase